ncbi:MAG: M20/M25/M40 family metallo-hydrolase [Firmicutes bacterium]|nr:M20/M25/M40 family metallo-hydrolase [Candidatus Colimorpha enterica]
MEKRLEKYVSDLSLLINIPTVSDAEVPDKSAFADFRRQLRELFPRVFGTFRCEEFDGAILLSYIVEGTEPILFMSHHDVVSENGTWKHEAFRAEVEDSKLYGRGTLDTKGNLWAILNSCEELLNEGFTFGRSVYIESSCNEETTGQGAYTISRELKKRGVHFRFTLDEGGLIVYDPIGGADGYFAMIAIGEKDCIDLKFAAKSDGGHSSTPTKNDPLLRLSAMITEIGKRNLFRPKLDDITVEMLGRLSLKMKGPLKTVCRHAGCLKYLLARVLTKFSPTANSMVRTTLCFTMAKGSDASNVIPTEAYVVGNMRLSHHDKKEDVMKKLTKIASKYKIEITELDPGFRSDACDHRTEEYAFLDGLVTECFPDVITAPYISTGASDSKYFADLSENNFRFAPFTVTDEQLDAIHAKDENIDISTLIPAVDFYKKMLRRL